MRLLRSVLNLGFLLWVFFFLFSFFHVENLVITRTRRLPLFRDWVVGAADSAETPRRPFPQTPLPAPPGGTQGVPRPAERHSPSSVSWAVPWASSRWDVPGTPPEEGIQEASGIGARATQLAPLDVEEQRLYSEPLPDGRAPHPISKGVPGHPTEEAHFSRLYPGSRSFAHDPKFMAIGKWTEQGGEGTVSAQLSFHHNGPAQRPHYCGSRTDQSVNLPLHSSLTHEQDPQILKLLHLRQELPSNLKRTSHPFPVENHGLRLGGADPHPSRFTLSCELPQRML
ncbi:hypothetical protein ILYODFUR_036936 [Ilyodon furcidens]|uniref:Uncharacterized protein n=1 Tax=Ilyodon furcidens TaxID=33524 RepID=A0ABV0TPX5_9TELE